VRCRCGDMEMEMSALVLNHHKIGATFVWVLVVYVLVVSREGMARVRRQACAVSYPAASVLTRWLSYVL
jgi:hypothetical protein